MPVPFNVSVVCMAVNEHVEIVLLGDFPHFASSKQRVRVMHDADFPIVKFQGVKLGQGTRDFWAIHVAVNSQNWR